jgi:hypothetical protein
MSDDNDQAVIQGVIRRFQTLADGTPRWVIDGELSIDAMGSDVTPFLRIGAAVAVARLTDEAATAQRQNYGQQAKELWKSAFFRSPDVWPEIGTDSQFLDWLKTQECAAWANGPCHGDIVPAHIRSVSSGSGTGIKPAYSAIPLCSRHHDLQHQNGYSALGTDEWWSQQRIQFVHCWAWETLKDALGYGHWNQVPPAELEEWALEHGVDTYLPPSYRGWWT